MGKTLFGTDGIRGKTNRYPMTPGTVIRVGQALGYILRQRPGKGEHKKVVIGKDTRLSGYMIEQALASGLNSMGVHVQLVGPLPTPGIGFLTCNMRADAGVVISASHNPFDDNGIKIFDFDGYKISASMEKHIEDLVSMDNLEEFLPSPVDVGRTKRIEDSMGRYIVFVKSAFPLEMTLDGLRIVLDCAHGAAYKVAPEVFRELGAEVIVLGNTPNGTNINEKSGALYPPKLAEAVVRYRADLGISLDGDADRVIMSNEKGQIVDGDHILAICAINLKSHGKLAKNTLVATHMSNFGLEKLMASHDIQVVKTDVGDKYVVEEMRNNGYVLGGEQSGHIIFLDHATTGDGLVAALKVLEVLQEKQCKLSTLTDSFHKVPQVLINCRVSQKKELSQLIGYNELLNEISGELKGEGRVFVRFSGTEPLVRVLVEGPNAAKIGEYAERLSHFLQNQLS